MVDVPNKIIFHNEVSRETLSICAVPGCENKPSKVIWQPSEDPEYKWAFVCEDCLKDFVEDGVMRLSLVCRAEEHVKVPRGVPGLLACLNMDVYAIVPGA